MSYPFGSSNTFNFESVTAKQELGGPMYYVTIIIMAASEHPLMS